MLLHCQSWQLVRSRTHFHGILPLQDDGEPSPGLQEEFQDATGEATDEEGGSEPEGSQEKNGQGDNYWDEEDELEDYLNRRLEASDGEEDSEPEAARSGGEAGGWAWDVCLAVSRSIATQAGGAAIEALHPVLQVLHLTTSMSTLLLGRMPPQRHSASSEVRHPFQSKPPPSALHPAHVRS